MSERVTRYQDRDGVRKSIITDSDHPNRVVVQTEQALDEILASIARDREIDQRGRTNKISHRLPTFVVEDLTHRGIYDNPVAFKTWLNSSEADPWRIWSGKL